MNHKRCVLYQDLISTYHKSCVQNLVISAKSEHQVLILTLRQGTIYHLTVSMVLWILFVMNWCEHLQYISKKFQGFFCSWSFHVLKMLAFVNDILNIAFLFWQKLNEKITVHDLLHDAPSSIHITCFCSWSLSLDYFWRYVRILRKILCFFRIREVLSVIILQCCSLSKIYKYNVVSFVSL